ncbi:DNA-directed RNA polymerase subunit H [Candidatus Woesearchaeota archaeon]|nr:MAG: DNA-directed RNA polymerase subunit H [Candidatus Woesearchaeota archaeon]
MVKEEAFRVEEHVLVPKHEKISEAEKKKVLEEHNITVHDLPKILRSDPAIAHLDCKEGDVIRIRRKSLTAGESVFYRGVIDG